MTYSSSLAINRVRFSGRGQNSVRFEARSRTLGPVSNTIILVVLACLVGLLYLTQATKTNAYGYQIDSLQQQSQQLQSQYDNLQVTSAQLQSVNRVSASSVAKSMSPATPSAVVTN